jgi:hypothetical protein
MGSIRNNDGEVVVGRGAELTNLQEQFIERIREEGINAQGKVAKELNYTSYYRDKNNPGTAFYLALRDVVRLSEERIEVAKGSNLDMLVKMRDEAFINGDTKVALETIKIINDMQGYKAPVKVQQTKIDVKATIDLTKSPDENEQLYIDVDYED